MEFTQGLYHSTNCEQLPRFQGMVPYNMPRHPRIYARSPWVAHICNTICSTPILTTYDLKTWPVVYDTLGPACLHHYHRCPQSLCHCPLHAALCCYSSPTDSELLQPCHHWRMPTPKEGSMILTVMYVQHTHALLIST